MKISIVILNFNGKKDTIACLKTVKKLELEKSWQLKTIIVDNASTDDSVKVISKKFPEFKLVSNKKNLGYAEGNNVGIRYALGEKSDYVLLLNNDTLVNKNLLMRLIKVMRKDKKIDILSPKIYFAPGREFHGGRYEESDKGKVIWYAGGKIDWDNVLTSHRGVDEVDQGQYDKKEEIDFATGCCMLIKREVLQKIGLFDQRYFLYWEDIDLCQRAKKAGFKVFYTGKANLWHKNASTTGGAGGDMSVYYQTRNRLLFAFQYASWKSRFALLREGIKHVFKGTKSQRKAVRDFLLLNFGQLKK